MSNGWTWSAASVRVLVVALVASLLAAAGLVAPAIAVEDAPHDGDRGIEVVEAMDQRHVPFERPERADWPAEVSAWVDRNRMKQGTYRLDMEGRTWLLVAWGQQPTGGYQVRVSEAVRGDDGTVLVTVQLGAPGPDAIVIQMLTHPFDLITVDETDASLESAFTGAPWNDEQSATTDPQRRAARAEAVVVIQRMLQ